MRTAKMLTFRRAIIVAAFVLAMFYLTARSHSTPSSAAELGQQQQQQQQQQQKQQQQQQSEQQKQSQQSQQKLSSPAAQPPIYSTASSATPNHHPSAHSVDTGKGAAAGPKVPSDSAVGQKTITQQQSPADAERAKLSDTLAYQFRYDIDTKFPAYIWQTWKYTPANTEFKFRQEEASWTELHPGFIHEVITDAVAVKLLHLFYASVPEVLEAYDALPLPVLKADFFRYLILLARGGIYSDIDTYALRSAVEWIPDSVPHEAVGLVIGIEADPDRPDWAQWYSRRIQFCQWTIQSKKGHPVLRDIVVNITMNALQLKRSGQLHSVIDKNVVELTGPAVWTDTIFSYFNNPDYFDMTDSKGLIDWHSFTGMESPKRVGDVIVLPITSFSPGVGQMGAKDLDDPMAFVKHDFEGTWKPENERHIGE